MSARIWSCAVRDEWWIRKRWAAEVTTLFTPQFSPKPWTRRLSCLEGGIVEKSVVRDSDMGLGKGVLVDRGRQVSKK